MIEQKRAASKKFISNELKRLTRRLEQQISSGDFPTLDEQIGLINKFKESFFDSLRNTHTSQVMFKEFNILNPVRQALLTRSINWDISGAYNRIEDIQIDLQTKINKLSTFKRQIEDRVARANSVITSTAVFNDIGVFEIGDSFNDLSRIDQSNTSPIAAMHQSRTAGILTLPREKADVVTPVQVSVLDSSNGFVTNKQGLSYISDNNPDTWFEYRRKAITQDDDTKLSLDLLIKFKLPTVVNLIKIIPLVLDDKSFPKIQFIETSLDGRVYQDIKDSLPSFIEKEEEDSLFTLGPVGSRNQIETEFVITPRVCQFIKIRIQQSKKVQQPDLTYHQIIALKDIVVQKIEYGDRGELLTTPLPLPFLAKRALVSHRAAETEPLTTIAYQISLDGGAFYSPMLIDTPLDVNAGTPTSISVDGQKREARLRLTAVRNAENFNGVSVPLASTIKNVSESISLSNIPFTFALNALPVQNSIRVFRPIATIGKEDFGKVIGQGGGEDSLTLNLPPVNITPFTEIIKVNGNIWDRVSTFNLSDPDATEYTIDYANNKVIFGDNLTGQVPESEIRLELPAEKVVIPDTSPYTIKLNHDHSFEKNDIEVKWAGVEKEVEGELLGRGATKHNLSNKNIVKSITIKEEVPKGVTSFKLGHVPLNKDELTFDDTSVFASGNYTATSLIPARKVGVFSPVEITIDTGESTDAVSPGFVTYEAIAKIINKRDVYSTELFQTREIKIYTPRFNSNAFRIEADFIDGKSELLQAGNYSIDYDNGIAYTFSETSVDGSDSVSYYYKPKKDLNWEFNNKSNELVLVDSSALTNKNDLDTIILEDSDIRYFVLYKDNRYIWMPFDETYITGGRQLINTANLDADKRPLQDTTPQTNFTFIPHNDFIKGTVLPAGKTRVDLAHQQIVKNSVRFIHISDDINSFDDRIITKDSLQNITVSPKPVKDVYGNSLTGSIIGTTTQRDIDKTKLIKEVKFINGKDELESGGEYSIDYKNGILYTVDPIPAHTMIEYDFSNITVSYIAHQELIQNTNFTINVQNLDITVNSLKEGIEFPNESLKVRYSIIENFAQDPAKIIKFYTPILYGYKLKVSEG